MELGVDKNFETGGYRYGVLRRRLAPFILALVCGGVVACTPDIPGGEGSTTTTTLTNTPPECDPNAVHHLGDSNNAVTTPSYSTLEAARIAIGMKKGINKAVPGSRLADVKNQLNILDSELRSKCLADFNKKIVVVSGSNDVSAAVSDASVTPEYLTTQYSDLNAALSAKGYNAVLEFDYVKYGEPWGNFPVALSAAHKLNNLSELSHIKPVKPTALQSPTNPNFGNPAAYLTGDDKHFDNNKIPGNLTKTIGDYRAEIEKAGLSGL